MKAFYCVGTHWDREWYEPFQEFRMWLVELIDELIDLMEKDTGYACFHLDGQAVVLQDYLEIRPERRDRLVNLLKAGRLVAGPWYDLPDEWLISGESFVRNIMMGMRVCRGFGFEPMKFAYTPDQFGHIAALPMIMTGFGLKGGICWRGTQDEHYPAQFVWVGPDGSRMPTHKLMDSGSYGPFDFKVRRPYHEAGDSEEALLKNFEQYLEAEQNRTNAPLILMLDAIDHQGPDHAMPKLLEALKAKHPDIEFVWTSLEAYAEEMAHHAGRLPEREGELRMPALESSRMYQYLIVHTISSRYPIKQRNDQCTALLEKQAEPLLLFQMMAGGAPVLSYLDKSWEYVLRNHPHDSICGCSIDQIYKDMAYRFDQAELIAGGLIRRALASLGAPSTTDEAKAHLALYNPLPFPRGKVFEMEVPFPREWPKTYVDGLATGERINRFVLKDADGKSVPFQLSTIRRNAVARALRENGRENSQGADIYRLVIDANLPPCSITGLRIEPTEEATRNFGSLMVGPMSASNGEVCFTLHPDGTGSLAHEFIGRKFGNLMQYEDSGDSGDGWTRGPLINDIVYRTPGARVMTAVDEDGPLRTVFRVEREFDLPRGLDRATGWRSDARVPMRVVDLIYVEKGAQCLRVRTRVENACMDHRLRVLFPTDAKTDVSFAETPFAVVERDVPIPPESARWIERINPEKAFTSFFGVQDGQGGLAVLAPFGLHEYEVTQTPDRSLALTLFRSTWQTVGTSGEPGGELLQPLEFEYLLWPFLGEFDAVRASQIVADAQVPVLLHNSEELPKSRSFLSLKEGKVVVTAIKPAADGNGGIIRLWNPGEEPVEEVIIPERPAESAALCDLNEDVVRPIAVLPQGRIPVTVPARGLATIRFTW